MHAARTRLLVLPMLLGLIAATPPSGPETPSEASWKRVSELLDEQKLAAAAKMLATLEERARAASDDTALARALVRETQVGIALGGYETAVESLAAKSWPAQPLARSAVELYQAQALLSYLDAYGWEIARREKVVSGDTLDLKLWTRDQITAAADRAFAEVWSRRDALGAVPSRQFDLLRPNDYPEGIRPSLRDAVAYIWSDRLADSSHWSPSELQDLWKLDLPRLVDGAAVEPTSDRLRDSGLHPLVRMAAILGDLERWHRSRGEPGAALEARLERTRILDGAFTSADDRATLRRALAAALPEFRHDPWWSMGMARLAAMEREDAAPSAWVRARATALDGERAFPESPGARICRQLRSQIEAPSFSLLSMVIDAPRQRSIEITHRNLSRLNFRAYRLPDGPFESRPFRYQGWNDDRVRQLLSRKPDASWRSELPPTADFRDHHTFVRPPLSARGRYVVVASADPRFRSTGNRLQAVELRLSDIVLLHDLRDDLAARRISVRALTGSDGTPLAGAQASLFRWQWEHPPTLVGRRLTDADGRVEFDPPNDPARGGGFAVVVRSDDDGDEAVWQQGYWPWQREVAAARAVGTLVFTDRSIYRPGQTLLWKTLTYEGDRSRGEMRTAAERPVNVQLLDPNGESVATQSVTTNSFGTASGSFEIPAGRLLGAWRVVTDAEGETQVSVEEYKRPTFEVALAAPVQETRLNRPVELEGEARYYFGLPVTAGQVRWRVLRSARFDLGWRGISYDWRRPPAAPRTIAFGTAELAADGHFAIRFTPEADERERPAGGIYRFEVEAELTDEGGETRSGTRSLVLGWVGVDLAVDGQPFLVDPAAATEWTIRRGDLDGTPRAGTTSWRIVDLVQPDHAALPAELPVALPPETEVWATPGDRLSPRWAIAPPTERILAAWKEGREQASGTLTHGDDGAARLALPNLAAGAYRLVAETRDRHGEIARLERSFVVATTPGSATPTPLAVALDLRFAQTSVAPGGTATLFVHSGLPGQTIVLEISRQGRIVDRRRLVAGRDPDWLAIPVGAGDRGGIGARALVLSDHQIVQQQAALAVPWLDKGLTVGFESFRDQLEPGQSESFRVTVRGPDGRPVGAGAAELVASMYDRSLDFFRRHAVPRGSSLYPAFGAPAGFEHSLGIGGVVWSGGQDWWPRVTAPSFVADSLVAIDPYGVGGPGAGGPRTLRGGIARMAAPAPQAASPQALENAAVAEQISVQADAIAPLPPLAISTRPDAGEPSASEATSQPIAPRSDFAETAFWQPHLVTGADGAVAIEFRVPEALTSWRLWVSAWTRELASGYAEREVRTAKQLMVRPYLPRFLREGDAATLEVVVNNGADRDLQGEVRFSILDAETRDDLSSRFGLAPGGGLAPFTVAPSGSAHLRFDVETPPGVRSLAIRVEARAGALSDGELRPLPVLPSRIRLVQSRFAALRPGETRTLKFDDMLRSDPTRTDEQLVVTVDGQLFYAMLDALPYLVDYPYECTEQTMNRFLSTAILQSMFDRYPAVAEMAQQLSTRETRWERFDSADPNRRMALEETPWLREARGRDGEDEALLRVLDPRVARAQRADALAKLAQAQLPSGAFPWFPGGPPSPYMTLYLMAGFAHAAEFGADVPVDMVRRGWRYLAGEIERDWWRQATEHDCCWELLTFANYVASSYPDPALMGDVLPAARRREILDFSFAHWKQHAPQSKLQLALTLSRVGRTGDARLVLDSIMDSAKSDPDLGVYWAPEDRAWLWYNDTTETHAWALRALSEIEPGDPRREGLVQWLFLQKKLGHWKSTRATAEVLYSLARYLEQTGSLATREQLDVTVGGHTTDFVFSPDRFTGKKNQIVLRGGEIEPARDATTVVRSRSRSLAFASATWRFTTDQLPTEVRGDLFNVERHWYRRVVQGTETTLVPLAEGERLAIGDELEVQLSIRARAAAEYVHLRDPRAAGLEPDRSRSGWRWETGLSYYEESSDSGTDFFFEALPAGEYTLRYRLRAAVAGSFRVAPAELESMYAPEFNAYSAGSELAISPATP